MPHVLADPRVTLEAVLSPDVALYDATKAMPKHKRRRSRRYRRKTRRPPGATLRALFAHHSGANGRPGLAGAIASAKYVMGKRGFWLPGYHYWIPRDLIDAEGRFVILRLVPSELRAWHTGRRANDFGEGLAVQGNTSRAPMTPGQVRSLEVFVPWWGRLRGLSLAELGRWLGWHSIGHRWGGRRKPACPGRDAERKLRAIVASAGAH